MQRTLATLRIALRSLPLFAGLFAAAAAGGCVLYGGPEEHKTCAEVACGNHASCGDGECFCDPGYDGNPYTGCHDATPEVDESCNQDCGQNAYCSEGACYCELDHVYVCGDNAGCLPTERLCDQTPDCPNGADEAVAVCSQPIFQEWLLTDACDDGRDIEWKLFALDRDWAWPGAETAYSTAGFGVDVYEIIQCFEGERICFAGASGDVTWGFNLDGTGECEACCTTCGYEALLDLGLLTCEQ